MSSNVRLWLVKQKLKERQSIKGWVVVRLATLKLNGILQFTVKKRTKNTETEQEESQKNYAFINVPTEKLNI